RATISALAPNFGEERLTGLGVDVIKAEAKFVDEDTLGAGDFVIQARRFIVATGSKPLIPTIPGLDRVETFTHEALLSHLARLPKLVVVGADGHGLALAQAYRRFGSQVTVVEPNQALPLDDPELTGAALDAARREGLSILEGARIERVE